MTTIEAKVCTEYYSAGSGIIKMYATIKVPDSVDILTGKYRLMNGDTIIRESSYQDYSRVNGEIGLSSMFDNELTEQELSQATKFVWEATIESVSKQLVLEGYNSVRCATGAFTNPEITTPVGTIGNILFHDTQGKIDVNGGGQLQYTLPIALPPGVKSVAPQINLIYTSGSGNGIAGFGWNLSGITSISRMGKTIEKDGEIKGIKLDYSDFYQFNGQRLILKSGDYGKDGAEYVTEKYSNIKIKSVGTNPEQNGPEYFEVTFEDGSQAWYGQASSARTPLEYNIVKWKDAQGNYISYEYIQNNNVAVISNISWGGNETANTSHFNNITFNYTTREDIEISYVNGRKFIQANMLSSITVYTNGSLFKKYRIEYKKDDKGNKYQFVKTITESNSKGEDATPVVFEYQKSDSGGWRVSWPTQDSNTEGLYGDFDGDGKLDILKYLDAFTDCVGGLKQVWVEADEFMPGHFTPVCETEWEGRPAGLYLFSSVFDDNSPKPVFTESTGITKEDLRKAIPFNLKRLDGEIVPRQGFVIYKTLYPGGLGDKQDLEIKAYSIDPISKKLKEEFRKVIPGDRYDESVSRDFNTDPSESQYWAETYIEDVREMDLDGDGLSDLVFSLRDTSYREINNTGPNGELQIPEVVSETRYRYLIVQPGETDIEKLASTVSLGPFYDRNFFEKAKKGDFNGDGIVDFLYFDSGGRPYLTTFTKNSSGTFSTNNTSFSDIIIEGLRDDAVLGDFTGDGKTDLLVPYGVDDWSWRLYISTGNGFVVQTLYNFSLFKRSNSFQGQTHNRYMNRKFFAQDLNKDGKADFIECYSHVHTGDFNESRFFVIYHENRGVDANGNVIFEEKNIDGSWKTPRESYKWDWYPDEYGNVQTEVNRSYALTNTAAHFSPVVGDFRINNSNENILLFQKGRLIKYSHYKVSDEARIISITQGGLTTKIDYKELDPNINKGFYEKVKEDEHYSYPYVEMDKISGSYAVSQLRQEGRKQDFKYRGFTAHLQGKGMIGFRRTARSSWYADGYENTKIWSGAEVDPLNEGLPIKEWSARTVDDNNLIFPNDISLSNTQLLSFKSTDYDVTTSAGGIKAIVPKKTMTKDFLKDITTESSIVYGDYYLPRETTTKVNGDYSVSTTVMNYVHNPTGLASNYFIGRPESKTETVQAYGDVKSVKNEYTYENNLLKTLKNYNRDNTGWIKESYNYDGFGNIIEKTISNSVDSIIQNEKSQYDSKGRFVIKKTDNLGLETIIEYNDWGQVKVQTDPLGNSLMNTYDGWGKLLISKTNLSGATTYTYEKSSLSDTTVKEYTPDGNIKETLTNKLGQELATRTKVFGEQELYTVLSNGYDALGRKTRESEPVLSGNLPTQWNSISYDDSVFPAIATATAFNGKQMKTSVLGNVTTVEELNGNKRITKKTTDALGNVISSEDRGGVINFSYNAAGEQIKAQYGDNVVTTKYDVWGRKSEFFDPSNGLYKYEYNGFGQIKKEISPGGYKEYFYNDKGQLVNEVEKSNAVGLTDKSIAFTYNSKGQLESKTGTSNGKSYSTTISYDAFGRVKENIEQSNGKVFSQKNIVYDDKSRISSYEKELVSNGIVTKASIENLYDTWSGTLFQMKDKASGKVLWNLQEVNAKGLVLKSRLGEVNIANTYDANNFLSETKHSSEDSVILECQYVFDAIKNELKERTRQGEFDGTEVFIYDDNNRLVQWTNPRLGRLSSNKYDLQGRIIENDQIGTIQFGNTSKVYQSTSVKLNADGKQNYLNAQTQRIIYNENNDPLYIQGKIGDVRFEYGLTNMRQMATYGGDSAIGNINDLANSTWEGIFTKYYSEDGSFEITRNNWTGEEKHILYIGGTPYESNVVYLKDYTQSSGSFMFLHKDYLGSILAVSDKDGYKVQEAYFDAWGNRQTGGDINYLDRGYTGHEHFEDIGIIHMNGRLYDPLLRRFLNADENIQDPNNTQNYNKYGYVLNNPLMYNDPSGEFLFFAALAAWIGSKFLAAAIIGAVLGLVSYSLTTLVTGQSWNIGGALQSMFWGAISGAITFGIGTMFTPAAGTVLSATEKFFSGMMQGIVHGVAQGILSFMQGGSFEQGFASGALGSYGASIFGALANNVANSAIGTIAFGALAGGIGSELTGGNFWQGVVIGGVVAGLNHTAHTDYGPKPKSNRKANYKIPRKSQESGWLSPTNTTIGGIGVLGTGFENLSGRTSIGMNFKLYPSGWRGNQYVSTYRIAKVGKVLGSATLVIGTALDTYGVYSYYTEGANSPNAVHPIKGSANLGVGLWGMLHPVTAFGAVLYYGIDTFDPRGFSGAMEAIGNTEIQHRKMTGMGLLNGPKF
ncbi:RHS repeat-associated core domain-containing protein [Elizabethkingia anophelis]|uniref:RHS repeat-associated core domain-containing protein n=1 Tax=Elizabethkingia anophelis TaxID=1117645 RepID=UPI001EE78038|nr:RHS repeat-associated core domain-containing protein [Elizabethkingia anophelis]UKY87830.1 VCBS repeat-containing protein [Elizabethkingia anophelis]UKZ01940.1 VCBS repeat-containing protein [Elizabethkingia anophelis]